MDISSRFSLVDFLAYLFPGILGTAGLYVLLLLIPLDLSYTELSDFTAGILLVTLSYIVGVMLSGLSETIIMRLIRPQGHRINSVIPFLKSEFKEELESAFNTFFGCETTEWSAIHFYVCRSLVLEFMPNLTQMIQRPISLRQLRANLIPVVTIWSIAGVGWGIKEINHSSVVWGLALVILSVIFWFPLVEMLINRMDSDERREVREVFTAFLAGYKAGLFSKKKSEPDRKTRLSLSDIFLSRKEKH